MLLRKSSVTSDISLFVGHNPTSFNQDSDWDHHEMLQTR